MELASGESPSVTDIKKTTISENTTDPAEKSVLDYVNSKGTKNISKDELDFLRSRLACRKLTISKSGALIRTDIEFEHFDPNNSTTAEGLLKLQILDWITGQVDRHPQNYFIDDHGNVIAIDNDCSFGKKAVPKKGDVRKQRGIVPNNASLMLRPPPVLTKDIADTITYLDPHNIEANLNALISPKELNATIRRLNILKDHISDENKCTIVDTSEQLLAPENKTKFNSNNSYWAREIRVYEKNPSTWNHLRKHRKY